MPDDSRTDGPGTAIVCPACGGENPAQAKFCNECGDALRGRPVAPSEARKTVTILFSDLVGSTALQAALDPESVRQVMARFYTAMSAELERDGGRVEKFIGDAVMAVFGTPVVREDDALRAVHAADAMRTALHALNEELEARWGVRLGMRTGVNTGEVVSSREGYVVGDTVNVAARLEQSAADGEVLVGEPTFRLTRHEARFEAVAPLQVKGKSEPLAAYRLLGATPAPDQRERLEAPLVGREDELARLRAVFELAVADRACRLATVVGSPGLGKTRLAQEFADEIADRAIVVEGRCEPSGEGITFLPVAEVLRDAAGIGEADSAEQVRERLAALVPDDPDRELLVERAAGVLGVTDVAGTEETFWSVRRLLGGLARERPLVVLLDDLHWGQPTFLDLVEHLVEWGRESPIMLLAMARPELRDARPSLTDPGRLAAEVVELAPLRPEISRQLASELLDRSELPGALAERILQTTEGNPLFLGEMLRMLVDDGVLRREGERWIAAGDAESVDVPPTITALLAARIERLGADERGVVERASVIGKQFYRGAVAELSSAGVAEGIDSHLAALHRKEVVEPDGTTWIDEPVFRFHHVLIRDAAYRGLLKEARAELHERFADWLQAKAGELVGEHEEVIAFHLEQAHDYRRQLGPLDDRGGALGERAVARLHSAGRRALAREDLPAATNLLRRASAALAEEAPAAGDVLVDLLEALLSAGETGEAASVLERLAGPAAGDPRLCAWMIVAGAQLAHLTDSTRLHETLGELVGAADALTAAGDDGGVAKAHHVRAQGLALLGQVGEVEAALDHALAAARRAQDGRRATAVLSGAPRAALWGPSPVMRASGRCLDVVRILRMTQGNRYVEAVALRCQAVLEAMRGRADAARQILDRCRMTLEELGLGLELLETEVHAGIVELVAGDSAAAEASLRVAYDGFTARGLDVGAAASASLLARAVLEQDRDDEAETLTRFSEERGGESLKTTIAWRGVRARVLARRGEHADAEALARRAVGLAEATDALIDHGDAQMDLAHVLRAAGRDDEAASEARRATELYEAKGHEVAAARAAGFAGERRAEPSVAGLVTAPTGVDGAPARVGRRLVAAFDSRDWEALRDCVTDDMVVLDRRPASPRGDTRGGAVFSERLRTYVDAAPDVLMLYSQLVDAGDLGLGQVLIKGHDADGGGAFVIPILIVQRIVDGRFDRMEFFNPEDERAALDRLLELQPDPAIRAAWRQQLDVMAAVNAGDDDALGATLAQDVELIDRRQPGWGEVRGRGGVVDRLRSPEGRMLVELVDTGADAVMSRIHVEGGETVIGFGQVVALRDGVASRIELFEPSDERAMRACLSRGRAVAAPLPPLAVLDTDWQRSVDRLAQAANRRDWTAFATCLAPGFEAVDHRRVATFGGTHGSEAWVQYAQGIPALSQDAVLAFPQFAGDGRIGAAHGSWTGHQDDGGGEFAFAAIIVIAVGDDGIACFEYFDPDDKLGACARLLDLQRDDEARALWRPQLDALIALDARDRDGLSACFSDDVLLLDHRGQTAVQRRGRQAAVELGRSMTGATGRVAIEFLEADGCAAISRWHGYGGEAAVRVGQVIAVRDGAIARLELFAADDRAAMSERFDELRHATGAPAAAAPAEQVGPAMRAMLAGVASANRRDWDDVLARIFPAIEVADHRRTATLGEMRGAEAFIDVLRATVAVAHDAQLRIEAVEEAAGVARAFGQWSGHHDEGGGAFELRFGIVFEVRGELLVRYELFDEDDEQGMQARFDELASEGGERNPVARLVARHCDAFNARDWPAMAVQTDDVVLVDRRPVTGWPVLRGPADIDAMWRDALTMSADLQLFYRFLEGDDEVAILEYGWRGHATGGGGAFEDASHSVCVARDGLACRFEVFPPNADLAMLRARGEELRPLAHRRTGAGLPDEPLPTEHWALRFMEAETQALRTREWDAVSVLLAPDATIVDHRRVSTFGDEVRDRDSYLARQPPLADSSSDVTRTYEVLAATETVTAGVMTMRGRLTDGGGPFEISVGSVIEWRDGVALRAEFFETDDEPALLARFAQLADAASAPAGPAARGVERMAELINARDMAGVRDLMAEDYVLVDHRPVSPLGRVNREEHVERIRSIVELAADVRFVVPRHVGEIDGVWVGEAGWVGHQDVGGGAFENTFRSVWAYRDERLALIEIVPLEDEAAALQVMTRVLGASTDGAISGPATTLVLRLAEALAERDWDAVRACFAADVELADHRRVATLGFDLPGGEGFVQRLRALVDVAADAQPDVEPLAELDGIVMMTVGWSGHMDDGGGPFDVRWRGVVEVRDGLAVRYELFDEDDEAGMLGAVARLRGRVGPAARFTQELCAVMSQRDWAGTLARFAPEFESIDRRRLALYGSLTGGERFIERARLLTELSADAVLTFEALDERGGVTAGPLQWTGHYDEGGGAFVLRWLVVGEVRAGLLVRCDMFEESDEEGMHARLAELAGTVGGDAGGGNLAVQFYRRLCDAFNARDWDAFAATFTEDITFLDRRALKIWPPLHGRSEMVAMWQNTLTMSPDLISSFEFVEGDDETAIVHYYFRGHAAEGGGELELGSGNVCVMRGDLAGYGEGFDHEDLETMRARREQLRSLARRRPGADLPDEPLPVEGWALALTDAIDTALRTRTWDALATVLAEDMTIVDRRTTSTLGEEVRDRDTYVAVLRAEADSSSDSHRGYEILAAADTITAGIASTRGRLADGGGPFEMRSAVIIEWRNGQARRAEFLEPDDEEALLARFAELA